MNVRVMLRLIALWLVAQVAGCGSPLVGLECRDGFTRCGGACYDLSRDEAHCGSCDNACQTGEMCIEGSCTFAWGDASIPDGGNAESDAGQDAGMNFPPPPPRCMGEGSPENCVCGIGELKCGNTCKDVSNDPENCGACDHVCADAGGFCIDGECVPTCDPPLTLCGRQCVNLDNSMYHCGVCNAFCPSGLCVDGECLGAAAGHIVAMGHDMSSSTPSTQRLFGNAVFLSLSDPVRVLVFDEKTNADAKTGVERSIDGMALLTGRDYTLTTASALAVTFLLAKSDVFVIAAQAGAADSALAKNGAAWSWSLQEFIKRGGVVVMLDTQSSTNLGTWQILKFAGLFDAGGRVSIGRKALTLEAPADGIATGVPTMYQGGNETVGFATGAGAVVVSDPETGTPVVLHIAR